LWCFDITCVLNDASGFSFVDFATSFPNNDEGDDDGDGDDDDNDNDT
jgi:hypothetical protein